MPGSPISGDADTAGTAITGGIGDPRVRVDVDAAGITTELLSDDEDVLVGEILRLMWDVVRRSKVGILESLGVGRLGVGIVKGAEIDRDDEVDDNDDDINANAVGKSGSLKEKSWGMRKGVAAGYFEMRSLSSPSTSTAALNSWAAACAWARLATLAEQPAGQRT